MNYNVKINLSKIAGAKVGKIDNRKYICIPLDGGNLFSGSAGVYLTLTAWEQMANQYGDTHYLKVQLNKDDYAKLSAEEKRALDIVGSLKPIVGEWQRSQKEENIKEITTEIKHDVNDDEYLQHIENKDDSNELPF